MKFKTIELQNFRQYLGVQTVRFSIDDEKNITLLLGDNLTGKTTLIQAFYWCFYGTLDLPNKNDIANQQKVNSMKIGEFITTSVKIEFIHENTDYTIERKYKYRKVKDSTAEETGLDSKPDKYFTFIKIVDGVIKDVYEKELGTIFPVELSKYFLFDGERLKHMMKAGKNKNVSDAVKTILGLGLLEETISHLKGVQKSFFEDREQFSKSNEEYREKYKEKADLDLEYLSLQGSIESFKISVDECEDEIFELDEKLIKLTAVKQDQARKKEIEREIGEKKRLLEETKVSMKKSFNNNFVGYLVSKAISTNANILSAGSENVTTISGLHGTAIHEIIEREKCICGAVISKGSIEYNNLLDQLKYQPPASKAVISKTFIEKAKMYDKIALNFTDEFTVKADNVNDILGEIEKLKEEYEDLKRKVAKYEDADFLQKKRDAYMKEQGKLEDKIIEASDDLDRMDIRLNQLERVLKRLSKTNTADALLSLREEYCNELIKSLSNFYASKETQIYYDLSSEVQQIFKNIVGTEHQIIINESDYSYIVKNKSNAKGASTGGDIMVAMSFIVGLIKVAKENDKALLSNEPYPLVLDAPFSSLDPRRKVNMGRIIPTIAEQVILMTFDDLQGVMDSKIGKRYNIIANDAEHTVIEKVI